jgi:hypothetical protein
MQLLKKITRYLRDPRPTGSTCPECGDRIFTNEEVGFPLSFLNLEEGNELHHRYCLETVEVPRSKITDLNVEEE